MSNALAQLERRYKHYKPKHHKRFQHTLLFENIQIVRIADNQQQLQKSYNIQLINSVQRPQKQVDHLCSEKHDFALSKLHLKVQPLLKSTPK